jgi:hypothetical protein
MRRRTETSADVSGRSDAIGIKQPFRAMAFKYAKLPIARAMPRSGYELGLEERAKHANQLAAAKNTVLAPMSDPDAIYASKWDGAGGGGRAAGSARGPSLNRGGVRRKRFVSTGD